ncbi:peptide chain release factor N(5)-glutamine methyltransferase [Staphylococcus hyicus]|uniref:peptide chain release factor N(5)-glutamine methyltransferase n=1 Tax=Staphylococcus hyicus TaxID=1284 RepID=UPI00217E81A0|nr:peptide chain release factor N(5)-glutamine methyltransferase [Staphylococcus hyicus]UWF57496.1 peptide chain release factor N(5)-glutamine methyltransferase [Staphylococcus hyicus]
MKFNQWVQIGRQCLKENHCEPAQIDWLIMDMLNWSRTTYLLNLQEKMTIEAHHMLEQGLARLIKGEPVQYVVGKAAFFNREYKVSKDVLIPRPETEEVVMKFMEMVPLSGHVADIGTGSGIIAITLKKELPTLNVLATDISKDALNIAEFNAQNHDADIRFLLGDTLKPLISENIQLDGLISNPPYICQSEQDFMSKSTLNFEPHIALFAKENGLHIYRTLFEQLPKVMKRGAPVVFEIGFQQGTMLKNLLLAMYPQLDVNITADINGNDRILSFKWCVK